MLYISSYKCSTHYYHFCRVVVSSTQFVITSHFIVVGPILKALFLTEIHHSVCSHTFVEFVIYQEEFCPLGYNMVVQ
jgi:hypothetical protein